MLMQIAACWKDHCEQMLTIRSTFLYLDRTYVISSSGTRSLFEMGLQLYGQHLAEHPEVTRQPSYPVIHLERPTNIWPMTQGSILKWIFTQVTPSCTLHAICHLQAGSSAVAICKKSSEEVVMGVTSIMRCRWSGERW
jgi:hypothetical protein